MLTQEDANNYLFGATAERDRRAVIDAIETYGADINHYNETNKLRPLIMATHNKDHKIIKTLLDAGADPTLTDKKGCDALLVAQFNADHESIEILEEAIKLKKIKDKAKKIKADFNEKKKQTPNNLKNVIKIY